jgi:excisionase family DNA binding protein
MEIWRAMKDVLTTGQVAKICRVTIRTVIKWFESGRLQGYKIPDSKDRRIPRENLRRFLLEYGVPHEASIFASKAQLLIADDDRELVADLRARFARSGQLDVHTALNGYDAGYMTARLRPDVLLIDYNLGDTTATEVLETIRRDPSTQATHVIVMTGFLDDEQVAALAATGLRVLRKPFDFQALEAEILKLARMHVGAAH